MNILTSFVESNQLLQYLNIYIIIEMLQHMHSCVHVTCLVPWTACRWHLGSLSYIPSYDKAASPNGDIQMIWLKPSQFDMFVARRRFWESTVWNGVHVTSAKFENFLLAHKSCITQWKLGYTREIDTILAFLGRPCMSVWTTKHCCAFWDRFIKQLLEPINKVIKNPATHSEIHCIVQSFLVWETI
jgi:hypothetical protein